MMYLSSRDITVPVSIRLKANSQVVSESHIAALRLAEELYLLNGKKDDRILLALVKELQYVTISH